MLQHKLIVFSVLHDDVQYFERKPSAFIIAMLAIKITAK